VMLPSKVVYGGMAALPKYGSAITRPSMSGNNPKIIMNTELSQYQKQSEMRRQSVFGSLLAALLALASIFSSLAIVNP
jgi:hypothetical protein